LLAAATVPILFFGMFATFTKVEANWAGIHIVGAMTLLVPLLARLPRGICFAASLNALLILFVAARAFFPAWQEKPDRILREAIGWPELATTVRHEGPLFGDSYQVVAMLRREFPGRAVMQWPGITRPSEFTREPAEYSQEELRHAESGGFQLVTTDLVPPRLPGFDVVWMKQLRVCLNAGSSSAWTEVISMEQAPTAVPNCARPIRRWQIIDYAR
jgi:hypothetical protein